MDYPKELAFLSEEHFRLPGGKDVYVSKADISFDEWKGSRVLYSYGGKTIVDLNGEPLFAELAILRLFQNVGWHGVWVDTFRRRYRTQFSDSIELPVNMEQVLKTICDEAGSSNGCWDIFCWKGDEIVFVESKRLSKDRIRRTQLNWLEAALRSGFNLNSFLVVQWKIK